MKKLLCICLAIAMTLAIGIPAFAANSTGGNTVISTAIAEEYTVTIPANTTIAFDALSISIGSVKLVAARLHPDASVRISVAPSGTLKNAADANATIAYALNCNAESFTSATFTAVNDEAALTVDITSAAWAGALAGSYSDTLTFAVSYINN